MKRFLTYIIDDRNNRVLCMTESEYTNCIEHDSSEWAEWVWQYAPDKSTAIEQHFLKHDEWQENPDRDTY